MWDTAERRGPRRATAAAARRAVLTSGAAADLEFAIHVLHSYEEPSVRKRFKDIATQICKVTPSSFTTWRQVQPAACDCAFIGFGALTAPPPPPRAVREAPDAERASHVSTPAAADRRT